MPANAAVVLRVVLMSGKRECRIELLRSGKRLLDGTISARGVERLRRLRTTPDVGAATRARLRSELFDVLEEARVAGPLRAGLAQLAEERGRLLVELDSPALAAVPWELLAEEPPGVPAVRYLGRELPALDESPSLPIRILMFNLAGAKGNLEEPFDPWPILGRALGLHPPSQQEIFRTTSVGGDAATAEVLRRRLRESSWDLVHLVGRVVQSRRGVGGLLAHGDASPIEAPELADLLRNSATRLAFLHLPNSPEASQGPLLDLAHQLRAAGGPVLLASYFPQEAGAAEAFYERIYGGLVQDKRLDDLTGDAWSHLRSTLGGDEPSTPRPALFVGPRSEEALRLSLHERAATAGEEMRRGLESMQHRIQVEVSVLERSGDRASGRIASAIKDLQVRQGALDRLSDQLPAADELRGSETAEAPRAVLPLDEELQNAARVRAEMDREAARVADIVETAAEEVARVVNSSFRDGDHPLRPDESLVAGRNYDFRADVGPPSSESHVQSPRPISERALEPFYDRDELTLSVLLWSDDFQLAQDSQLIRLPRIGPSNPAIFSVQAPAHPTEKARLRASVYFQQNLIQSLLVTAVVTGEPVAGLSSGNSARVEYALSGTLLNLRRLPPRTLNILTNHDGNGVPAFTIVGSTFKDAPKLDPMKLSNALEQARRELLTVGFKLDKEGKPAEYLFDAENRGGRDKLKKDLIKLATIGRKLFGSLVSGKTQAYKDRLRQELGRRATIQVSRSASAGYVFPWALVYDKRLVTGSKNQACPAFLKDLDQGGTEGFLAQQTCLTNGCAHDADPNVVCPSGFWGFKHLIEQPPSRPVGAVDDAAGGEDDSVKNADPDPPLDLVINGDPIFLMAVHQGLTRRNAHRDKLKENPGISPSLRDTKEGIGAGLVQPEPHVVYFYCHGGSTADKDAYLSVGASEQLFPEDLDGWEVSWKETRPLVFINGCHTTELTPDQLLSFVGAFSDINAVGIVGTEVSIDEQLACWFGERFFVGMLERKRLGDVIRDLRLRLLEKRNPMGLAYTPYCSADLRLWVRRRPETDVLMLEARRSPAHVDAPTEAPALEALWKRADLRFRIVSNDVRFQGALTSQAYLDALRGNWSRVVHLAMHGDAASLVTRWSEEADVDQRQPIDYITPSDLRRLALGGALVVSGACSSGSDTLVQAFLAAGARAYMAPEKEVPWASLVQFFAAFYDALAEGKTMAVALAQATAAQPEAGTTYRIYGDGEAVLKRVTSVPASLP